jgi:cyclopropane-fatty-acyl-phospholipid synthase
MTTQDLKQRTGKKPAGLTPEQNLYQAYDLEEETRRSASHYEFDPEFYSSFTGGEWNVYSGSIWEPGFTLTQAQEKKLDKMAELMRLQPGMHLLDVGCGWGGPLVYFCHKYGVTGHGITVTANQLEPARARAARYGVPATFELIHWQNLPEQPAYDVVCTDEVLVHFHDLGGFFKKAHAVLRPGGRMVNKELHFTHPKHSEMTRSMVNVNAIYGYTGNYRTLAEELTLLNQANFELQGLYQIPLAPHYQLTADAWLSNMYQNREKMRALVGEAMYLKFRKYLKLVRVMMGSRAWTLDIVVGDRI